jgi:Protein of unknown function (DUF4038)/Putative collagen-binding domain of a collagenase
MYKSARPLKMIRITAAGNIKKILAGIMIFVSVNTFAQVQPLKISANKRYFQTADGKPFFWLGETAWLLFVKCNRKDVKLYLDTRKQQGFNVIQAMLLHDFNNTRNVHGDWALKNFDVSTPAITPGSNAANAAEYDYWDNVDYIIDEAARRGMYMALVPTWGSNVKSGKINEQQAEAYAKFLAKRYKNKTNIIWLNGGDINGKDGYAVWEKLGSTIKNFDGNHLMTFHPRGRTSSTDWFHQSLWLDFNMFQSGHKSYTQDTAAKERRHFGEDNWKFVEEDYAMEPVKPTLDGEPSYEDIPYGLHDTLSGYWNAADIRRYAYWNVFAGGAGFTYGHNAVMQFYEPGDTGISFFPRQNWKMGLNAEAATQMKYLKKLMQSYSYFDRVPAQELVYANGEKYERVLATKGKNYALFYVYDGKEFRADTQWLKFIAAKGSWFNPRTGLREKIAAFKNKGVIDFNPPGKKQNGNDWVLILEK